jgi:hypothetical protein
VNISERVLTCRLTPDGFRANGTKSYRTGALFADWVMHVRAERGRRRGVVHRAARSGGAAGCPRQAVPDVVNEQGAALAGKMAIDAVNRIGAPELGSRALIAAAAPSARYVRAFNSLGWENFAEPLPGANKDAPLTSPRWPNLHDQRRRNLLWSGHISSGSARFFFIK